VQINLVPAKRTNFHSEAIRKKLCSFMDVDKHDSDKMSFQGSLFISEKTDWRTKVKPPVFSFKICQSGLVIRL